MTAPSAELECRAFGQGNWPRGSLMRAMTSPISFQALEYSTAFVAHPDGFAYPTDLSLRWNFPEGVPPAGSSAHPIVLVKPDQPGSPPPSRHRIGYTLLPRQRREQAIPDNGQNFTSLCSP